MERQKMKHRRQLGLRQGMLGIILLCWVLPVVLIVTLGGVYILDSMTRQYRSDMMRSAQSAAAITGRNLDSMIAASRKASYIATMGNAWASYTKTGDYVTFYNEMQTFLTQQYRYDDKFRNTIVTLVDDPAAPIYTSNTSYTSIRKYQQHVRDEVLVRSEALGTGIGFFAADGSLYMMRNLLDANYRTYGVLVMELNTDTLFDSMRSVIWMTDATVWLGDAEYTVAGSVRDAGELRGNIRAGGQGGAPAQGSYAVWGSENVVPGCALEYIVYSDTAAMRAQLRSTALLLAALLAALLPVLKSRGLKVGVIREADDLRLPAETDRLHEAGAEGVAVFTAGRYLLTEQFRLNEQDLLALFERHGYDLVLLEGFGDSGWAKIEVVRSSVSPVGTAFQPMAIVGDVPGADFALDDPAALADWIENQMPSL